MPTSSPGEGRIRESGPVPALSSGLPHTLDRGRYLHGGTSSPGGRGGSGRANPPASSFFWFSPYTGPWGVSPPRGGIPGEGRIRESKPPRQLILLAFPTHWTVGGISTGGRHPPGEGRLRESEPPRQLFLLAFPTHWTVGGISTGGGADGEGRLRESKPVPALSSGFPHIPDRGRYLHGGRGRRGGPHPGE